jgi:uncharacterized protein (TIRG00374 family)
VRSSQPVGLEARRIGHQGDDADGGVLAEGRDQGKGLTAGVDIKEMLAAPGHEALLGANRGRYDDNGSLRRTHLDLLAGARAQRIGIALAGLACSAVFAALALRRLDVAQVLAALQNARLLPWVPLAVAAYIAGHFVRGRRLRLLVRSESALSLATATNVVVAGYASNNAFPARLGELVRAGLLAERTGMPVTQSLTVTFIERLLDGIVILVLLLAGAWMMPVRPDWVWSVARIGSIVFAGALGLALCAVFLPSRVLAIASRVSAGLSHGLRDRVLAAASAVTSAGAVLRSPRGAVAIVALSFVAWILEAAMFAAILPVFSLPASLASAAVAMSVTNLGILVPSSPGYVGPFHFFCSQALASQGVAAATAMGYAVLVHLTFYVPVTLWGAIAILWYGFQVGAAAAMARSARCSPNHLTVGGVHVSVIARVEPPRPPRPASAYDRALVEAVVTPPGQTLDADELAAVAQFLAEEMGALPPRLRFLYEAGMSSFRLYVRVRTLRSFCGLSLDRRRAAVDAWAFGRIAPLRQLFRPVRSTALLAYYERALAAHAAEPSSKVVLARVPVAYA